jgi:thiol-disulfide isomerase/thioredoxin
MTGRRAATLLVRYLAIALPLVAGLMPGSSLAVMPAAYKAQVIEAQGLPERYEFDLTTALNQARKENRRLYVYLGARDCPFCRKYEAFLDKNAGELAPLFVEKKYIVVELRSALSVQANRLFIRIGKNSRAYADFQRDIGDERARQLVYPSVWLLDANAKPLMQMPAGTGTFETVEEQIEILNLVQ